MNAHNKNPQIEFDSISMRLASPEKIKEWSYGEVTKPETVNYRTQRSERNGLFDQRIFGPEKDYECYCGKYRGIRYKGIICERCGVEVTRSIVRRERMGHIELATPVAHIWFLRGIPSRMGLLLNLSVSELEKVVYFSGYIITKVDQDEKNKVFKELEGEYKSKVKSLNTQEGKAKLKQTFTDTKKEIDSIEEGRVIDEAGYHKYSLKYGQMFEAEIGAEAIHEIFKKLDLDKLYEELTERFEKAGAAEKVKLQKRINLVKTLRISKVRPEWMFLTTIPVIPPAIRPMVTLDGGRHATSDVNDLYRRVINRNNRLKKLADIKAPDVIQRNEKRILQEAVDALIDNSVSQTTGAVSQAQRRPLKSLSDTLKGKQGRFRQNLLGKRVDYSGRSVIVIGPELKLSECGLPKHMALELFRPFVISKLLDRELAFNIRGAGKLIDEGVPEVWEILEEVIKGKRVLLNRAPTLHRLGIQAFQPVLIEGNAIQVHPLVCEAYNADFDGDQMAVHLPLSEAAQKEANSIMASDRNLLGPATNEPIARPKLDLILGCYWMTNIVTDKGEDTKYFNSPNAAILAYDYRQVDFREKIMVMPTDKEKFAEFEGKPFETSVGRLLFNSTLPSEFPYVNVAIRSREMGDILQDLISRYGMDRTPDILDKIKNFGFKYATRSGISWGIDDVIVPEGKKAVIDAAKKEVEEIESQHEQGFISDQEKYRMSIEIWTKTKGEVEKLLPATMEKDGPIMNLITSGARGSMTNVIQMAGMKGLVVNTANEIINFPIIPSYKEGLSPLEYFVSTHGARKGNADTALNTAQAGYLTRKLVYVSDSVIIREDDCKDAEGRIINKDDSTGIEEGISHIIRGRYLLNDVKGSDGKVVFKKGDLLKKKDAKLVDEMGAEEAHIRTPMSCKTIGGVCKKCYGLDLARNEEVALGESVGVVAAQAIGEPGTQLTMRTFHQGGIAQAGGDITMGLPRVIEILERRNPKSPAVISEYDGTITDITDDGTNKLISVLVNKDTDKAKKGKGDTVVYKTPSYMTVRVKVGEDVVAGQIITDGSASIADLFKFGGRLEAEKYIMKEIHKIYEQQGAPINRKHIEVIVRQMFSRKKITDPGATKFTTGEFVEDVQLDDENKRVKSEKGAEAKTEEVVLGISEVSLTTSSYLSNASFQNTQRILTETALAGGDDKLRGIKENVLVGRLIPVGTGLTSRREEFEPRIEEEEEE